MSADRLSALHLECDVLPGERSDAFIAAATINAERLRALYSVHDEQLDTKLPHVTHSHSSLLRICERFLGDVEAEKRDAMYFDYAYEFVNKTLGVQAGHMPLSIAKPLTKEVQAIAFAHLHSLAKTFAKTSDRNRDIAFRIIRRHLHPESALMISQREQLAHTVLQHEFNAQSPLEEQAMWRYMHALAENVTVHASDLQPLAHRLERTLQLDSPLQQGEKTVLAWVAVTTSRTDGAFAPLHDVAFDHILSLAKALHYAQGDDFFDALDRTSLLHALAPDSPLNLEQKKRFTSVWIRHPQAAARAPEAMAIVKPLSDIIDSALARVHSRDDAYAEHAALARHILGEQPNKNLELLNYSKKLSMLYVT